MRRWRPIWRWIRFRLLYLTLTLASRLPRRVGLWMFGGLGLLACRLLPRPRNLVIENTRLVYPDWPAARRSKFAREVFRWVGRNGFDFVRLHRYSPATIRRLVTVDGLGHLEAAHRQGRGVICVSAHMGCWELIPFRLRVAGYPVAVVYRRLREPDLEAYVAGRRGLMGIEVHDRDTGARGMLRSLRRGSILGVLIDQRTRVDSVQVPFLGVAAWTPSGPVRLALRRGIPLVPLVIFMRPDGRHELRIGRQMDLRRPAPDAGEKAIARSLRENTTICNDVLGEMILAAREQWVWFHPRWRDRGPQPPAVGAEKADAARQLLYS